MLMQKVELKQVVATMTTLKQLLLFLLVLLVAYRFVYYNSYIDEERVTITLDDLQITPPSPLPSLARREPKFHYLMLSLQWPNAYCNQRTEKKIDCDPPVPQKKHRKFTIHGLWPKFYNGSSPTYCTGEEMKNATLNLHEDRLMDYWPDLRNANRSKKNSYEKSMGFWKNQWNKHGKCSSNKFPPQTYLEKTLYLGENYGPKILTELEDRGIKPDGNTTQSQQHILNTIYKATGKEATVTFNQHISGISQIFEIRLCFDGVTVKPMDCKDTIFTSASTRSGTEDHGNDSENELEDAAELKLK